MSAQERRTKRLELEVPVWDSFWFWLETLEPLSGSLLEKAVNYAANHRELLGNYLLDGRYEISNNAALSDGFTSASFSGKACQYSILKKMRIMFLF